MKKSLHKNQHWGKTAKAHGFEIKACTNLFVDLTEISSDDSDNKDDYMK